MKHLLTITVTAIALAAFSSTVLAGDCGSCPADTKKDKAKDKTEQSSQS